MAALQAGTKAPDFSLHTTPDQAVALHDFRGRRLILCFYPADWSPVCGDQVTLYNELLPEFRRYNAELLGISVDGVWCHLAFAKDRKLHFPLLSDFEPKGRRRRHSGGAGGHACRTQAMSAHTPRLTVPVGERDHIRGPVDAPLTLLKYGDFECPHCGAAYPVVEEVRRLGPRRARRRARPGRRTVRAGAGSGRTS